MNQAPERFIVVGDIHGCAHQLEEILEAGLSYGDHRWVFLGDYIGGPDSERVVRLLREQDGRFLLGNHEERLLQRVGSSEDPAQARSWLDWAGLSIESYDWLASIPCDHLETQDYVFVHGGLDPAKPLQDQTRADFLESRFGGDYLKVTAKTVVHGHQPVEQPTVVGNRINVNTNCGKGGPLTAVVLPERIFLQSSHSATHEPKLGHPIEPVVDEELEELGS